MPETLLYTKFFVPPKRPLLMPRPRLVDRLNQGLQPGHKFTLVSAPAGFGKTTSVSVWVHAISEATPPIATTWLSLDEGDNDLTRFLAYLIAALKQCEGIEPAFGKGVLTMLQSPQPSSTEALLTPLINEMASIPGKIVLVLDDYHLIEAQPVHDALSFLLDNSPPQMHLVVATREDPPLMLSRLRARGQLTEIRATDLRFTTAEAADFLNRVMGLDLSPENIAALETRTEGWITGLQLAAISMQGSDDSTRFIRSFTGSHHFVMDYLIEEVLAQQPDHVEQFLLQTAVLDQLTGSLCNALTGRDDGQETLAMLEHANLFLMPLDEQRQWYRYHHLFADLLRRRLHHKQPELTRTMHIQASGWYAQNGFIDQAVEHALASEDFDRALHLLDSEAETLWGRDEHIKLRHWFEKIPAELIRTKPHLGVIYAWSLFVTGEQAAAAQSLDVAEQALGTSAAEVSAIIQAGLEPAHDAEMRKQLGRIAVTRAFLAFFQNDVPAIIKQSRLALDLLPAEDLTWRSSAAVSLGDAYSLAGQTDAAYQARLDSMAACQQAGNVYMVLIAGLKLAATLRQKGYLQQTIDTCQQQIQIAGENNMLQTPTAGCLYAIWGEALAELGNLDEALELAKEGVALTQHAGDVATLGWSYLCLTRILLSVGDLAAAEEIIHKANLTDRKLDLPPWFTNQMVTLQTRVHLARNEVETAAECLAQLGLKANEEISFQNEIGYLVLARILIAQGRYDEADNILQQILSAAEAGGRMSRAITALMLQAVTLQFQGRIDLALERLARALDSASAEGHTQVFVDEGLPMARLLQTAVSHGIALEYSRRLLAAFPAEVVSQTAVTTAQVDQAGLAEPLSEREIEILQKIAEGLTNPQIADQLYLSLNTVKVHTRNIYGKLDVHNRTQAVAKARALGILPAI